VDRRAPRRPRRVDASWVCASGQDIRDLRSEMRQGFTQVRSEMREGFGEVRGELSGVRGDINDLRLMMIRVGGGVMIALVGVIAAILARGTGGRQAGGARSRRAVGLGVRCRRSALKEVRHGRPRRVGTAAQSTQPRHSLKRLAAVASLAGMSLGASASATGASVTLGQLAQAPVQACNSSAHLHRGVE
jgi:hypothetical protein